MTKTRVGRTTVDKKFTYITHSNYADRFTETDALDVITSDLDFFHRINFIDTPGTGWTLFDRKEVNDLLSAADIILFSFHPNNILDAESAQALYEKFTYYEHIPIWYVVTHASDYVDKLDFENLPIKAFADDLLTFPRFSRHKENRVY